MSNITKLHLNLVISRIL